MAIILGLDISTTCIGWSVIQYKNLTYNLIGIGYFEPIKNVSNVFDAHPKKLKDLDSLEFLDMIQMSKNMITELLRKYNPDKVCIEDYIRYMAGGSGANTIIPLACLNRSICSLVYEYFDFDKKRVSICNVMSIRSLIKKSAKLSELPKKEELPPILEKLMGIKVPILLEESKRNKSKISSFTYDQSDSIACSYYITANNKENK